jgi:hypothetical protein
LGLSWAGFIHLPVGPHILLTMPLPVPPSRSISHHYIFHPKGGSQVLWNIGILLQCCIVSESRRPWLNFHCCENLKSQILSQNLCKKNLEHRIA